MIKDNGIGMDLTKFEDRVFDIYQADHGQSGSNGVGLFIVKNQVEALRGSIKLVSSANIGNTFTIQF